MLNDLSDLRLSAALRYQQGIQDRFGDLFGSSLSWGGYFAADVQYNRCAPQFLSTFSVRILSRILHMILAHCAYQDILTVNSSQSHCIAVPILTESSGVLFHCSCCRRCLHLQQSEPSRAQHALVIWKACSQSVHVRLCELDIS